ncbi:UNVERIFIED_CONTAM: hypothetical protein Slati_2435700 [Sesamum latifolium]|uniref:Uncharacterized protein n=1 Tax=Sesamum latifolium TaxID=2727402 RepID=A0AAW2WCE9_9LAMI
MELSVGSHSGPDIYVYCLRPYFVELLDIGTSYPIWVTTVATASPSTTHLQAHRRYLCHVMTGDGSSSWNSPSSLHILTASDKAYDDHIRDTVISRTNPGYSHCVHMTAVIPQVRGLLPYYRSRGFESYRPSLQGFHMTIPRVSSVGLTPSQSNPLRSQRRPTSVTDKMRHSFNKCDS